MQELLFCSSRSSMAERDENDKKHARAGSLAIVD